MSPITYETVDPLDTNVCTDYNLCCNINSDFPSPSTTSFEPEPTQELKIRRSVECPEWPALKCVSDIVAKMEVAADYLRARLDWAEDAITSPERRPVRTGTTRQEVDVMVIFSYISAQLFAMFPFLTYLKGQDFAFSDTLTYFHEKLDRIFILCSALSVDYHLFKIKNARVHLPHFEPQDYDQYFGILDQSHPGWLAETTRPWGSLYVSAIRTLAQTFQTIDDRLTALMTRTLKTPAPGDAIGAWLQKELERFLLRLEPAIVPDWEPAVIVTAFRFRKELTDPSAPKTLAMRNLIVNLRACESHPTEKARDAAKYMAINKWFFNEEVRLETPQWKAYVQDKKQRVRNFEQMVDTEVDYLTPLSLTTAIKSARWYVLNGILPKGVEYKSWAKQGSKPDTILEIAKKIHRQNLWRLEEWEAEWRAEAEAEALKAAAEIVLTDDDCPADSDEDVQMVKPVSSGAKRPPAPKAKPVRKPRGPTPGEILRRIHGNGITKRQVEAGRLPPSGLKRDVLMGGFVDLRSLLTGDYSSRIIQFNGRS
jgi:hypothetical protein